MGEEFPFDGEFYRAHRRRFEPVVFFVHFFLGRKILLKRHIEFVNRLGFDAFAFNLQGPPKLPSLPLAKRGRFGLKHIYADQIETLLDLIPGEKIVYSFSNPTAGAIEAIARREGRDVRGLIADSGPTTRFVASAIRLYKQKEMRKPWPTRWLAGPTLGLMWSPRLHKDLPEQLESFPDGFPVLSIRGAKDPLIPPKDIGSVFEPHRRLNLRTLILPDAGHLNGLRDFPEPYEAAVEDFVRTIV